MTVDRRGNIVLTLLFALLLAASGAALLTHTGYHHAVIAARRDRRLEAAVLEQALLLGLHRYREKLAAGDMNAWRDPQAEFFSADVFPAWSENGITGGHEFSGRELRDGDGFRVVRIDDVMRTRRAAGSLEYAGCARVELVAGDVPVGEAGLLVAKPGVADAAAFLADHGVGHSGSQLPRVGDLAPGVDAGSLLCAALGLPVEVPDWRRIREAFGLEPGAAPVPAGIYLARGPGGIDAVFVEGDLQTLEFSAGAGRQTIIFGQAGGSRELSYRPGEDSLAWSGEGGVAGAGFGEKIVVHGSVFSVAQAGAAAFLDDARVELLVDGRLVIVDGLESENLAPGRERFPKLLLMTCANDFFSNEKTAADVVITAAGEATVQAQVIAAGGLVNGEGKVQISGALFAADIENRGHLQVDGARGDFALGRMVRLPGFKLLRDFRVLYVEERSHDE